MKFPGIRRKRQAIKVRSMMALVIAVLLLFCVGVALGSSEEAAGGHETAAEEHGGASGEHAAEGAKGWKATDTYRVMNFLVLAIGLYYLMRKPASEALNARIKGIKDELSGLEEKKKNAEKELAAYDEKLARLDEEFEKIVAEYVRQGNEAKVKILKEAESAAERLKEQARRNIDYEFEQAKAKLRKDTIEKALEKAEEIIKNEITAKDQDRLVDEFLEKVVA
ncbi:MAG: ATP synthase F0 subunit B [Desulfobacterales bacterium]|nr:ATP synthase F0 subunit B [Desulfobacterales bacterium]